MLPVRQLLGEALSFGGALLFAPVLASHLLVEWRGFYVEDNRVIYYLPNAVGARQINFNKTMDYKCHRQSGSRSNQQNMLF